MRFLIVPRLKHQCGKPAAVAGSLRAGTLGGLEFSLCQLEQLAIGIAPVAWMQHSVGNRLSRTRVVSGTRQT